jgi:cbb3-type cytochrome oxidase maturation protein
MDPQTPQALVLLIPISAIIMGGLVKIARLWGQARQGQVGVPPGQLEARLDAMEHELTTLQQDLTEAQERLDFAERMLAQSREQKRLGGESP